MSLRLLAALSRLTMNEREAFLDSVLCGRSQREIARTMGCTRQNVEKLIRTARRKLAMDGRLA